jgi:hypothetical protein
MRFYGFLKICAALSVLAGIGMCIHVVQGLTFELRDYALQLGGVWVLWGIAGAITLYWMARVIELLARVMELLEDVSYFLRTAKPPQPTR